jgi:dipeptidyl aminopeptidase/acylaminoacyl peptidase
MMRTPLGALALIVLVLGTGPLRGEDPKPSKQFGTVRLNFAVSGKKAFLIQPTKPAPDGSKPWVWYAPTFLDRHPDNSHTWMFAQLLDKGFAIGGIEVGESYGSPAGRKDYQDYYLHVTKKYGLAAKACLLPQSRGGLMLYNWAVEHPEAVQCIAGIYTVCNIESYPGIDKAAPAYGLKPAELREKLSEHNPIDRLAPLAKAKVPILHIHGDSDKVVPLEKNAGELAARYEKLGGPITLEVVKGKGHQVAPEFFQSQKFVDFLLAQGQPAKK